MQQTIENYDELRDGQIVVLCQGMYAVEQFVVSEGERAEFVTILWAAPGPVECFGFEPGSIGNVAQALADPHHYREVTRYVDATFEESLHRLCGIVREHSHFN